MASDLANSLKTSLRSGKPQDCEEFIRLAQPIVASAIARILSRWGRADRDRVDDLVQDTFARLYDRNAQALRSFHSDQSDALAAWLRAVAGSVALDSLRSGLAKKHGAGQPLRSLDDPGLTLSSSENTFDAVERTLLNDRINRCLQSHRERDRSIFWLYYRQGFTAKDIAGISVLEMGAKGVETTIYRVTRAVRECMGESGLAQTAAAGEGNRR